MDPEEEKELWNDMVKYAKMSRLSDELYELRHRRDECEKEIRKLSEILTDFEKAIDVLQREHDQLSHLEKL